ncbi:MAG TPA: chemotaxis protein CheA [Deltaproteobacteria bacterium]|nr:MAG: hypothetical protein A2Z79_06070 [Deltaproteobacteria bacterium GWA2_55_82]OGQ62207.1 MAG: hypothetical protein A3I81_12080 [Deltaproteobacteria bacterium RIFCSPLOWO2_02_FULL_55_12]OIJ73248.1 MAG: hypothetical protein A2V21_302590 [Deltaproteobacteria bacterium GWC2_55_46]HBG45489.1 chemotaxis protein CheA [Deltaproteobacteria bacterium]HCY10320.1 chemotaxis protein CheA [Deltaproteobacteria bacterium]
MTKTDLKSERFREFLAEAEDILNSMGKGLNKLGKGVKAGIIDPAVLNAIFRSAHTLKGMCGIFEFKELASLSHSLEDTLDLLRLGRIALTDEVIYCIISAHDLMVKILTAKGTGDFSREIDEIKSALSRIHVKKPKPREEFAKELVSVLTEYEEHRLRECLREGKSVLIVTVRFPITNFDKGYMALTDLLRTEAEVIATLPSSKSSHELLYFDILIGTCRDRSFILGLIKDAAEAEIRMLAEPAPKLEPREPVFEVIRGTGQHPSKGGTLRRVSNTVRVNISKLDYIMNLISELGMLKSSIASLSGELKGDSDFSVYGLELSRTEKNLERKLSELRDSVLDVRMVPIGQLFGRFDTFLGKLSREAGKEIRIVTRGDDTELDKLIVEELADPLMHIIRNVVDHALEAPAVREALGKPRTGTIILSAYQKGNHVVVEVKDDGTGIDTELVKEKAVSKGLVTREYADRLSRLEALDLIFLPGFSTRDIVSETSGRGVGMDVVKENITRLSGIIDIETVKGKGTRFLLTIPITLAIIQALIIEESGKRYAVPLNSVLEIVELRSSSLDAVQANGEISIEGRMIPALRLSRFFSHQPSDKEVGYGIVAGLAEHRLCLVVDHLVEELDVVIKPLSRMLKVPGIAGATDMGEKGTLLVLDVTGILDQVVRERKPGLQPRPAIV